MKQLDYSISYFYHNYFILKSIRVPIDKLSRWNAVTGIPACAALHLSVMKNFAFAFAVLTSCILA